MILCFSFYLRAVSLLYKIRCSAGESMIPYFASGRKAYCTRLEIRPEKLCFFIWHPGGNFMLLILSLLSLLSLCLSVSSFRWSFLFRSLPFYCFFSVSVSIDLFCLFFFSCRFVMSFSSVQSLLSAVSVSWSLLFLFLGLFSVSSRSLPFCSLLSLAVYAVSSVSLLGLFCSSIASWR